MIKNSIFLLILPSNEIIMRTCFARPGFVYILTSGGPYDFACKVEFCKLKNWFFFLYHRVYGYCYSKGSLCVTWSFREAGTCRLFHIKEKLVIIFSSEFVFTVFRRVNDGKKLYCLFCEIPILMGLHLEVLLWSLAKFALVLNPPPD